MSLAPQYAKGYLALSELPFARGEKYWKKIEKSQGKEAVLEALRTGERYYRRAFLVNPMVELGILGRIDESSDVRQGPFRFRIWWLGPFKKGINQFVGGNYERAHALFDAVLKDKRAGQQGEGIPDGVLW